MAKGDHQLTLGLCFRAEHKIATSSSRRDLDFNENGGGGVGNSRVDGVIIEHVGYLCREFNLSVNAWKNVCYF